MSLRSSRWLIERLVAQRPAGQFLEVYEDGARGWSPDHQRAMRFATEADAQRFAGNCLMQDVAASEHAAADLVQASDPEGDGNEDFAL